MNFSGPENTQNEKYLVFLLHIQILTNVYFKLVKKALLKR